MMFVYKLPLWRGLGGCLWVHCHIMCRWCLFKRSATKKKESPIKNYRTSSLTNQNFKLWKLLFEVYNELPPSLHCKGTNKTVLVKCIFKFNKSLIQKGLIQPLFSVILILKALIFLRFFLPFLPTNSIGISIVHLGFVPSVSVEAP